MIGVRGTGGAWAGVATVVIALFCGTPARGQASQGISVVGTGTARVKPTQLQIPATLTASAELAADALTKFRDQEHHAQEAIKKLGIAGLTLEEDGPGLSKPPAANPMMAMAGGSPAPAKESLQINRQLRLVLKGIDAMPEDKLVETMTRIVDAAKDAGLMLGNTEGATNAWEFQAQMMGQGKGENLVAFSAGPEAMDAVRDKAVQAAIDDARKKAGRIARLAGVKLGSVVSVHEKPTGAGGGEANPYLALFAGAMPSAEHEKTSATFGEIPVTAALQVEFGIEK